MSNGSIDDAARREIEELAALLRRYQREYYVEGRPSVSDIEYDRLFDRLLELEREHPQFRRDDSPTVRVGSDLTSELPEVEHTIPVLSLDKAYSSGEVETWIGRTGKRAGRPFASSPYPRLHFTGAVGLV
ncbi:MAG TPA: hypothetical protein ENN41_11005, partial [Sediminispirochaeta sp.]|nr:hypothetical protein [Sediminispirochaeta sp.]